MPPADPFDTEIAFSGLPGAATIRRAGPRLGLRTVRDLVLWLPRRYDDLRTVYDLASLRYVEPDLVVSTKARVMGLRVGRTARRGVSVVTARLGDATGTAEAQWYGRQYVERRLREGQELLFSGKLKKRGHVIYLDNPSFGDPEGDLIHAGRIVPVYPLTAGLPLKTLRTAIRAALDRYRYPEYLPHAMRPEGLPPIGEALEQAHFPDDFGRRDRALRRIASDELLALQVGMVQRRRERTVAASVAITVDAGGDAGIRSAFARALSDGLGREVALTDDQQAAMDRIRADVRGPHPMLRLIQGDVGSGKTAVAAYALALAAAAGVQGVLLAPTDLLARQHAQTLDGFLRPLGIPVEMLTGSLSSGESRRVLDAVRDGRASVVVGTHALFSDRVEYKHLGLVVVDEQHRFGVEQRGALEAKTHGGAAHVLLMTATPIPRTVGQVLYADLDVSDLRTVPSGRLPVKTTLRRPDDLDRLWSFVVAEALAGRRTFVVVPHIDEVEAGTGASDAPEDVAGAEAEAERLRAILNEPARLAAVSPGTEGRRDVRVGLVHGRIRTDQRDETMRAFRDGSIDVLVGTTVVEVGVDVPAATIMVIQGADRFGLAQLHQLRGRVGRGPDQAFCVLVAETAPDSPAGERLAAVVAITDGFLLAEKDFELRREGDVLGYVQSGFPRLRVASLARKDHRELAIAARSRAEALVDERGLLRPSAGALATELGSGWLAGVFRGEPASPA